MKMSKKMLSIILAIMMIVTIVPITASAATSGTCGDDLTWSYDTSTYTLTISGTGAMEDYDENNRPWEEYEDKIKTLSVHHGVTNIGNFAFYSFDNLVTVHMDSVSTIGNCSFMYCRNLNSISLYGNITTIGSYAFAGCKNLKKIDFSDSVTVVGEGAFSSCYNLTNVVLGKNISNIGDAVFFECTNLINIIIDKNVISIGENVFSSCTSLKNIYYLGTEDNWKNISINSNNIELFNASMHYNSAGGNCGEDLIWLLDINTGLLTISGIGDMENWSNYSDVPWHSFRNNINSVVINDGVTSIGNRAFNKSSIKTISIPDSLNIIGKLAFYESELIEIDIPDNVTVIADEAFMCCEKLSNVTMPKELTYLGGGAFFECGLLTSVIIPSGIKCIGMYTFMCCFNLVDVYIPEGIISIGESAFDSCNSLTNIIIPEGVESITDWAFSSCINLKNISLPKSLKYIGEAAFRDSENISNVYYSGTEKQWNDISVYGYNSSLLVANIHYAECTEHLFDNWQIIVEPTYTTTGEKIRKCINCDEVETAVIPVLEEITSTPDEPTTEEPTTEPITKPTEPEAPCADGHIWSTWATVKVAECKKEGLKTRNCTVCGEQETEVLPATGECAYKWVVTKEATATENGEKQLKCTMCGYVKETQKLSVKNSCANGHNYTSTVTAPTCTEQGYTRYTCTNCADMYKDDYISATGHNYTWYTISVVTCETDGVMLGECTVCGETDVKATLKTGHNIVDGVCQNCGYSENVENDDTNTDDNEDNNNEEVTDPSENCSCNCHKSGISNFFFKIGLFFQRIFGSNKYCGCGVAHY